MLEHLVEVMKEIGGIQLPDSVMRFVPDDVKAAAVEKRATDRKVKLPSPVEKVVEGPIIER